MNNKAIISSSTLKNIADKYRSLSVTDENILMADLPNKLADITNSESITESKSGRWIRPEDYPNLDTIDISEINNVLLATYDNTDRTGFVSIKASLKSSARFTGQLGYLNDDNEFILIDTLTSTYGTSPILQKVLSDYNYDYIILKIVFDEDNINYFGMTEYLINSVRMTAKDQPALEVIAKCKNSNSHTAQQSPLCGYFTKRVKLIGFKNCTTFNTMFQYCYSLEEVEFEDYDFSKVTVLTSMFQNCISLRNIIGLLDADLPECTGVTSMFSNCNSLKDLTLEFKFHKLDSTKLNFFSGNSVSKLESINFWMDLSECDTLSEILIKSFGLTSRNIQRLDFSNANFGDKKLNFETAFQSMYELRLVDLSGINFDNITDFSSTFNSCKKLVKVIGDFDFSNSDLTSLYMMFNGCYSLRELELKGLSKVTNMTSILNGCYSIKSVRVEGLTSALTLLNMKDLQSVESIIFDNCDLSGVTSNTTTAIFGMSSTSNSCARLKLIKIDIPTLDISSLKTLKRLNVIDMLNNLIATETEKTIKLPLYTSIMLTDEDIETATNKGWRVAF